MNKLLIIDGSNLLFQMFFGMPSRIYNKSGKGIWGVIGFVGAFLKILRMANPSHIVILFDGETKNERKELDQNYKANRPDFSLVEDNENPFSQLQDIYTCLDFLKLKHAETTDCETDDIIASYVREYEKDCEIVISSYDSDFFQLISNKVTVLRYRGENSVLCTPNYIEQKLNIKPNLYADFKSLTGDNADNIKGAKGVGPKTAAALINQFGSLENLLQNTENIQKPAVKKAVLEDIERLRLNYKLIKLSGGCCLPFSLNELEKEKITATTTEVLKAVKIMD